MSRLRLIKGAVIAGWLAGAFLLAAPGSLSEADGPRAGRAQNSAASQQGDYVGSDTCATCHDVVAKSFAKTTHARLPGAGWKDKVTGCESCHGAGGEHVKTMMEVVANGTDPATVKDKKITYLAGLSAKQVSDTCLKCHAGREEHNTFRRGEHWRNDVACTDCHSPHAPSHPRPEPKSDGSSSLQPVGPFAAHASDFAARYMLRKPEALLCMSCHNETKAQFNRPFHHKVLEGAMNCSDCHNPHGGFEQKQARLATGADAACFKCHADKQGPFVFEHAPLKVEGCAACHDPHGSANPKMLKRSTVAQLCIECHTNTGSLAGEDDFEGAAQVPHDVSNPRYRNCTICHVKIHGSNTSNKYFR